MAVQRCGRPPARLVRPARFADGARRPPRELRSNGRVLSVCKTTTMARGPRDGLMQVGGPVIFDPDRGLTARQRKDSGADQAQPVLSAAAPWAAGQVGRDVDDLDLTADFLGTTWRPTWGLRRSARKGRARTHDPVGDWCRSRSGTRATGPEGVLAELGIVRPSRRWSVWPTTSAHSVSGMAPELSDTALERRQKHARFHRPSDPVREGHRLRQDEPDVRCGVGESLHGPAGNLLQLASCAASVRRSRARADGGTTRLHFCRRSRSQRVSAADDLPAAAPVRRR